MYFVKIQCVSRRRRLHSFLQQTGYTVEGRGFAAEVFPSFAQTEWAVATANNSRATTTTSTTATLDQEGRTNYAAWKKALLILGAKTTRIVYYISNTYTGAACSYCQNTIEGSREAAANKQSEHSKSSALILDNIQIFFSFLDAHG